ncbi:hypothetical protein CPB85DRAFT_1253902 [Mucidula mucida]|nr:hypothetical protein CPB85DRAFT_1253902 [Mucidula mucida]
MNTTVPSSKPATDAASSVRAFNAADAVSSSGTLNTAVAVPTENGGTGMKTFPYVRLYSLTTSNCYHDIAGEWMITEPCVSRRVRWCRGCMRRASWLVIYVPFSIVSGSPMLFRTVSNTAGWKLLRFKALLQMLHITWSTIE